MKQVSARDANQQFSRILAEAEAGEEVVITRRGEPVATLRAYQPAEMTPERKAALEAIQRLMHEGLPLGVTRPFTRDEMHER